MNIGKTQFAQLMDFLSGRPSIALSIVAAVIAM